MRLNTREICWLAGPSLFIYEAVFGHLQGSSNFTAHLLRLIFHLSCLCVQSLKGKVKQPYFTSITRDSNDL